MTLKLNNYKETSFQTEDIIDFFRANDHLFVDPFSNHIDISAYVDKLVTNAEIILGYDKCIYGLACAYMNDIEGKIAHWQVLLVDNTVQNAGIGRKLTLAVMECARCKGMNQIELTVDTCNSKAIHLYQSLGFEFSAKMHGNINKAYMVANLEE